MKTKEELLDMLTKMVMHTTFHLPMVAYGYDENGQRVFLKSVSRRAEGCPKCDELYTKYPVMTIG